MFQTIDHCRSCDGATLHDVLSLGEVPLADKFLSAADLSRPEPVFPLNVAFCGDCSLVQIRETVEPDVLFGSDYPYFSSFSPAWVEHCRRNAEELIASRDLGAEHLVVEIASNDGYMLRNFHDRGIATLGIDPVPGPAAAAEALGIPTLRKFFSAELAENLTTEGRFADVILGNNVLAHVADLSGFVNGIRTLLKPGGVAVIEAPYVRDLIDHCEFDTVYHEHLCYFSVTALNRLFLDRGLCLTEVRRLPTHGGSIRLYIEHGTAPSDQVCRLLDEEAALGIDSLSYYESFAQRVSVLQESLVALLDRLRSAGKTVAGYGAAAKGTTLLNASGVRSEHLDFIVDRNIYKHGHHMPGLKTPIFAPERLLTEMPDYVLLLAWNFQEEIIRQQSEYLSQGGRFIVPVPEVRIVDGLRDQSAA
ncbi:MAG: class I SAM-dependent methyltransferase [Planctomycetaceae bacterium]|nr:class I SAM-dependent methyltransferase [Planctomycetaceae bacterium]